MQVVMSDMSYQAKCEQQDHATSIVVLYQGDIVMEYISRLLRHSSSTTLFI